MKHSYYNSNGKITIKPLALCDIESMRKLRNTHRDCFVYSEIITPEEQKIWFDKYLNKPNDYVFSVFLGDKWIGSVSIYDISDGTAEFGRLLIDSNLAGERGLGLDTTLCTCSLAFKEMGVSRIVLQVYESNIAAYKTYVKAGFSEYGYCLDDKGKKLIDMELLK